METPCLENLNASNCSERSIMIHYFDFWRYLKSHYPEDFLWTERLYWYYNNLTEHPTCPVCGKPTKFISLTRGYQEFCSNACLGKSKDVKERKKQTSIKHYGVENPMHSEEVKTKLKNSNIKKYGVENPFQSEEVKEKIRKINLERYGVEYPQQSKEIYGKSKQTNLKKYGFEYNSQAQEIKDKKRQTNLDRYGVECYTQTEEFKIKDHNTKKKNNSFGKSKIEEDFSNWLIENNINFERQHHDDKYPFDCDFYFPDKDLYLEIQGCWVHGEHPFNPNDENDIKRLIEMQDKNTSFYQSAIETWTVRDPLKRETAKKNNLNWIEVFSTNLDDVIKTYQKY